MNIDSIFHDKLADKFVSNMKNKSRHNNDNQKNKFCNKFRYDERTECNFFDHDNNLTECGYPWNRYCKGDIFKCKKLKYQWFASLSDKQKQKYLYDNKH